MKKYTEEKKRSIISRYSGGDSVDQIKNETGIPRSTIYNWLKSEKETVARKKRERETVDFKAYKQLKEHAARLEEMLNLLKTCGCAPCDPLDHKLRVAEQLYHTSQHSVRLICEALDIPRGTFYNHIFNNKRENSSYAKRREQLRVRIQEIYDDSNQIFGAPKIAAVLQNEGIKVSKEMVRRLMREMGLESVRKDAKKQYTDETRKLRNIVNREFAVDKPNQVWVSDVTYFHLNGTKYYICVIIDLYARKAIACRIGTSNSTHLVKITFKDAYESRHPDARLILHTDQGANYRSRTFCKYLNECGVQQSFSKPGVPYDNSVMESFFNSMKREELYRYKYRSEKEFRASVDKYIDFYNNKRPHKTIRYKTPEQKEREYADNMGE